MINMLPGLSFGQNRAFHPLMRISFFQMTTVVISILCNVSANILTLSIQRSKSKITTSAANLASQAGEYKKNKKCKIDDHRMFFNYNLMYEAHSCHTFCETIWRSFTCNYRSICCPRRSLHAFRIIFDIISSYFFLLN